MIRFDEMLKTFYLNTEHTTYAFKITEHGFLKQLHYGGKADGDLEYIAEDRGISFGPNFFSAKENQTLDTMPNEYAGFGIGDFRTPAYMIKDQDGSVLTDFRYKSHEIIKEKPLPNGLPVFRGEDSETLIVRLKDDINGMGLALYYTVYEKYDAITRRAELINSGRTTKKIKKAASLCLDLLSDDKEVISFQGAWANERNVRRQPIDAVQRFASRRGASSHQMNPFLIILDKNACEDCGNVYAIGLVYSGSFAITTESDQTGRLRIVAGLNEENFCWKLGSGESFSTPEAILVYTEKGVGNLSHCLHDIIRERLIPERFAFQPRPIVLNSWEGVYFKFTTEALLPIIEKAAACGVDTFVLDDGWFGVRNSDSGGLGDWYVNEEKLKGGLKPVIDKCKECGMKFGLWFEPEMISPTSELYKKHPDWAIKHDKKVPCTSRNQYVLDFSNPETVEYIKKSVSAILSDNDISYVKWDFNRHITENYSMNLPADRQGEVTHRFMLGVYELCRYLAEKFPNVLFEGCSGGGGRFDLGMLAYFPQIWTSDNTDACARMRIQHGTSFCYPLSAMSGHVSVCPNHQTGRTTPYQTRCDIASLCTTGYEFNANLLSDEEIEATRQNIARYKKLSDLVLKGDLYRLEDPTIGNYFGQMIVSKDKKSAFVVLAKKLSVCNDKRKITRLKGLDEDTVYVLNEGEAHSGKTLMNVGLPYPECTVDFQTFAYWLESRK